MRARDDEALRSSTFDEAVILYMGLGAIEDRAVEVRLLLADRGQHRAPSIPDLVVAAAAELASLVVLHHDEDFDLIAQVTGQAVEWLTP